MRAKAARAWYGVAQKLVAGFCYLVWRVHVTGREHIPSEGAFILAPSHRSNIDTLLCGCMTSRPLRYMAKASLWRSRPLGWLCTSLGGFPVARGTADRHALRTAEEALAAGDPVVLFPEGMRREGSQITDIHEGAAFVAQRAGVPIVPVGIGGSELALPKGSRGLRPVKVAIVIGEPLLPPVRQEGGKGSRRQVRELSAQLGQELQRLFTLALEQAGVPS